MDHKQPFSTFEAGTANLIRNCRKGGFGGEVRPGHFNFGVNQIWSPIRVGNNARKPFLPIKSIPRIASLQPRRPQNFSGESIPVPSFAGPEKARFLPTL